MNGWLDEMVYFWRDDPCEICEIDESQRQVWTKWSNNALNYSIAYNDAYKYTIFPT